MKIIINEGTTTYCLSKAAYDEMGLDFEKSIIWPLERLSPGITKIFPPVGTAFISDRDNPKLVACVEKLGTAAGGPGTFLKIIEIPDGSNYKIEVIPLGGENLIIIPKDKVGNEKT